MIGSWPSHIVYDAMSHKLNGSIAFACYYCKSAHYFASLMKPGAYIIQRSIRSDLASQLQVTEPILLTIDATSHALSLAAQRPTNLTSVRKELAFGECGLECKEMIKERKLMVINSSSVASVSVSERNAVSSA